MRHPNPRGAFLRPAAVMLLSLNLALVFAVPADGTSTRIAIGDQQPPAARTTPVATLHPVRVRYVRAPIPIRGSVRASGRHLLVLQRFSPGRSRWTNRATTHVRHGAYRFAAQYRRHPGPVSFRTVLYAKRRPVAISNVITVQVIARNGAQQQPQSVKETRTVDDAPYCPQLIVRTHIETRTINWQWDAGTKQWVPNPTPWVKVAGSDSSRPATATECLQVQNQVPAGAALPDLRIKDLTRCGAGDMAATNGTCFKIVDPAPLDTDFPALAGKKLLKFGVVTLNVGAGNGEVVADRSSSSATDWKAYQTFYDASGKLLGSVVDPGVQFYYAGDGHNHWHFRDFDEYDLLDASGATLAHAEKHGYCMQDNTTWDPMQGMPGVSSQPTYTEAGSCGKGLPDALSIIHGLSRGWGDTYPTSLPDQCIDITGLPDGTYTVRVHADAVGALIESNENNNTAEVKVQITGDTVTVVPGSSTGGL